MRIATVVVFMFFTACGAFGAADSGDNVVPDDDAAANDGQVGEGSTAHRQRPRNDALANIGRGLRYGQRRELATLSATCTYAGGGSGLCLSTPTALRTIE
jgi:hypothetical protein